MTTIRCRARGTDEISPIQQHVWAYTMRTFGLRREHWRRAAEATAGGELPQSAPSYSVGGTVRMCFPDMYSSSLTGFRFSFFFFIFIVITIDTYRLRGLPHNITRLYHVKLEYNYFTTVFMISKKQITITRHDGLASCRTMFK